MESRLEARRAAAEKELDKDLDEWRKLSGAEEQMAWLLRVLKQKRVGEATLMPVSLGFALLSQCEEMKSPCVSLYARPSVCAGL